MFNLFIIISLMFYSVFIGVFLFVLLHFYHSQMILYYVLLIFVVTTTFCVVPYQNLVVYIGNIFTITWFKEISNPITHIISPLRSSCISGRWYNVCWWQNCDKIIKPYLSLIYITRNFQFKNGELDGIVTVGLEIQRARSGSGPWVRVFYFQERPLAKKLYLVIM